MRDDEVLPVWNFAEILAQQQQQQQQQRRQQQQQEASRAYLTDEDESLTVTASKSKKERKGLRRRLQETLRRGLSLPTSDDTDTGCEPSIIANIPLEVASQAVPLAEDRLSQILSKSRYINRHNRIHDVPCFSPNDFQVDGDHSFIGRGGFANVHKLERWNCNSDLTEDENQGKVYAVKSLRAECARSAEVLAMAAADLMFEACILSAIQHPHIIHLRGISTKGIPSLRKGRVDGLFLILDYLDCTLYQLLKDWRDTEDEPRRERDSEPEASNSSTSYNCSCSLIERLQVTASLASALEYLHAKDIIYRDLKPSNVGFDAQGCLKLFDFGLAVEIPSSSDPNRVFNLAGKKGTARYIAYEVAKKKQYNCKADVFSLATLVWELVTLEKPYGDLHDSNQIIRTVLNGNRPPLHLLPVLQHPKSRSKLEQLIQRGWSKHIEDRPTMKEMHQQLVRLVKAEEDGTLP